MSYLNTAWKDLQTILSRRVEVDLIEVSRVIELARRTPCLSKYEREFHELSIYFGLLHSTTSRMIQQVCLIWWHFGKGTVQQSYNVIQP